MSPPKAKHTLDILSRWLSQAMDEGRAALESLLQLNPGGTTFRCRSAKPRTTALPGSMHVSLTVPGKTMVMHPVARDEVYRVALEAIRNACLHSRASEMNIELCYGREISPSPFTITGADSIRAWSIPASQDTSVSQE